MRLQNTRSRATAAVINKAHPPPPLLKYYKRWAKLAAFPTSNDDLSI